jgi:hypothetical protein
MSIALSPFEAYRMDLYNTFPYRSDALMDLIDALAANTSASSPVELSLNPLFPRQHSSVYDAIDSFFTPSSPETAADERNQQQMNRVRALLPLLPQAEQRPFNLLGLDATTEPRPHARTLEDRGVQYSPNQVPGNKPITHGHSYSLLGLLPEKTGSNPPPWVLPLTVRRIPTSQTAATIGAAQVADVMNDPKLPFGNTDGKPSVLVADCYYSACQFLGEVVKHDNLATIVRVRGNRVFHDLPPNVMNGQGRPPWFGDRIPLGDLAAGEEPAPETVETVPFTFRNGLECQVTIKTWREKLMRGKKDIPMHKYPFTLVCVTAHKPNGEALYKKPLWLVVIGERRHDVSPLDAFFAYRQRYDLEHYFRFAKNRLLMSSSQTPDVRKEENWWEIVALAYVVLYMAAPYAVRVLRPWERTLPEYKKPAAEGEMVSPSMVQRSLPEIISGFGTMTMLPKPRGNSLGRAEGVSPGRREARAVIKKGKKSPKREIGPRKAPQISQNL